MIDLRPVLYTLGWLLLGLAVAMWAPVLLSISSHDGQAGAFLSSIAMSAFVAGALIITNRTEGEPQLRFREAAVLTTLSWLVVPAFGALPFLLSTLQVSFTDAYFETVSGLSTTGSTVLSGLDHFPPSILIWRSILQWLGGFGIIGMSIAVMPYLRVGGMQLFRLESSDRSEKFIARPEQLSLAIGGAYVALTALCTLGYNLTGMSLLEAVNHAMCTISTAGFSTSDASFAHFQNPWVEVVGTVFMFLGSCTFLAYVRLLRGGWGVRHIDPQIRTYFLFLVAVIVGLSLWLFFTSAYSLLDSLRYVSFNVVSIVSTTGFVTTDYTVWGSFAVTVFFFLCFVGGCTGSSTGGLKIFRFEIISRLARLETTRLVMPHRVLTLQYAGRPIDKSVLSSVGAFSFAYVACFWIFSLALVMIGLDPETSFSGVATTLGNVGPGLGPIIGPTGNFAPLPGAAKWILSLAMIMGRLEVMVVAMLLMPRFYRD